MVLHTFHLEQILFNFFYDYIQQLRTSSGFSHGFLCFVFLKLVSGFSILFPPLRPSERIGEVVEEIDQFSQLLLQPLARILAANYFVQRRNLVRRPLLQKVCREVYGI